MSSYESPVEAGICHCRRNGREEAQEDQPEDAGGDADPGKSAEDPFKEVRCHWSAVSLQKIRCRNAEDTSWTPGTASVSPPSDSLEGVWAATGGDSEEGGAELLQGAGLTPEDGSDASLWQKHENTLCSRAKWG